MFDNLKKIIERIRQISESVDDYKKLSPSGAMPSVAQVSKAVKLLKQNKFAEAEKLLLEAEELYPTNEAVYRTLGYLYEASKDFERAIIYFQNALNLNPIKKDLFIRLGYAQLSARQNEGAKKTFENAMKVFPLDSEIITGFGMALYRLERFTEARVEFVKAFSLDAHNLNALFLTATIDIMSGDYERAETRLSLLIKLAPLCPHLYEYARLKHLKGDYAAALELAERAHKLNKDFLPIYLLIADVYHSKLELDNALIWLDKAEEKGLCTAALYLSRANIYMYKEDFQAAIESYTKSLEYEQSKMVDIKILICRLLLDEFEGDFEIVKHIASEACADDDAEYKAVGFMLLGVCEYKKQNLAAAEDSFRKALQVTLKLPVVYYLLAKIYEEMGDNYKTDKYYNLTLEKNPYHYNAHKDYLNYLFLNGNFEDVRFKVKKVLKLFPNDPHFENILFYVGYRLLDDRSSEYNVKELIKLAEKLEENSTFLYANEKIALLERVKK